MSVFSKGVFTGFGVAVGCALLVVLVKFLINKFCYYDDFSDIEDDWNDEDFEMYCRLEEELFGDKSGEQACKIVDNEPSNNMTDPSKLSYEDVFGQIQPGDLDDLK